MNSLTKILEGCIPGGWKLQFTRSHIIVVVLTIVVVVESLFYLQLTLGYNNLTSLHKALNDEHETLLSRYDKLNATFRDLNASYLQLQSQCESLYGDISVEQAKYLMDAKPTLVIVDVRTASEYRSGHIEEAINICLTCNPDILLNSLNSDDEILLYCKSGIKSSTALHILQDNGYEKVYNMVGGIDAWKDSGYPVVED